jgi:subtilisin family serine protease
VFEVDKFAWEHQDFLILFAAGNDGARVNTGTVGSPGSAKNALTVGSSQNGLKRGQFAHDILSDFSSKGPTIGGRIKPDVVAPGHSVYSSRSSGYDPDTTCGHEAMAGTSMATPVTAGNAALVREYFESGFYAKHLDKMKLCGEKSSVYQCDEFNPSAALIKSMLVNSGVSMNSLYKDKEFIPLGNPPDVAQGFGRTKLDTVIPTSSKNGSRNLFVSDWEEIEENHEIVFTFKVFDTSVPISVALVWTDAPGYIFSKKNLMHNLDLDIIGPKGRHFFPNNLNTPEKYNNVEKIVVTEPKEGEYLIRVSADYFTELKGKQKQTFGLSVSGAGVVTAKKIVQSAAAEKPFFLA